MLKQKTKLGVVVHSCNRNTCRLRKESCEFWASLVYKNTPLKMEEDRRLAHREKGRDKVGERVRVLVFKECNQIRMLSLPDL